MDKEAPLISFVAPSYDEAENLPALVEQVAKAAAVIGKPWEFIIVNDASSDNSLQVLAELKGRFPQLRIINMDHRSGQTAALEAGFRHVRGSFVGTLDADLQNDPAEFPRMLQMVQSGQCDMLTGWRKERNDKPIRLVCSRMANHFRNWMTGEKIHDSGCSLKVFTREVAESFKLFNGLHRFLPALARMNGFRVLEVPVNHRARTAGVAKYGVWNRLFKASRDIFALRWMQARVLIYKTTEVGDDHVG